ncbi:30S ribosome-binding factor RbfA [Entomospira entomophila]|uniref:Ribosome-binding factor A n=1 Tax=Entomospira entomophila TaxID=2719988 RepID=A0A968KSU2_9SPIO|nr:30S ribosome-binding factor RbfA [Entomospira entomophilus]NIZ40712.1 30S ribosome-binding factor RbfA [Entomospira entomophilus]WDI34925.1 30S ribosome-binding factor RbfA [Entomospira entomophilus]
MDQRRHQKLTSSIEQIIMTAIIQGQIKDPRVTSDISITEIDLSRDLSQAKIYISSYKSKNELEKAVEGLNSASGIIRTILGRTLQTRNTPKPIFIMDERIKDGFYLGNKIVAINRADGISAEDVQNANKDGLDS